MVKFHDKKKVNEIKEKQTANQSCIANVCCDLSRKIVNFATIFVVISDTAENMISR